MNDVFRVMLAAAVAMTSAACGREQLTPVIAASAIEATGDFTTPVTYTFYKTDPQGTRACAAMRADSPLQDTKALEQAGLITLGDTTLRNNSGFPRTPECIATLTARGKIAEKGWRYEEEPAPKFILPLGQTRRRWIVPIGHRKLDRILAITKAPEEKGSRKVRFVWHLDLDSIGRRVQGSLVLSDTGVAVLTRRDGKSWKVVWMEVVECRALLCNAYVPDSGPARKDSD